MNKQRALKSVNDQPPVSSVERAWDIAIFFGVVICSALALAAVAIATPVVLILSVLFGMISQNADGGAWRPAKA